VTDLVEQRKHEKYHVEKGGSRTGRSFIGADARIIMGDDEVALVRLWREKRGEVEPEDLSGNLIVQLGVATEDLNRRWYGHTTGQVITDVQRHAKHAGRYGGWRQPWSGGLRQAGRCSRPSSCCRDRFRRRHASGEWIASDWPVCAIADTATPHRMGRR
jgi:hypothetical protein